MSHAGQLETTPGANTAFPRDLAEEGIAALQQHALTARVYLAEYFAVKVYPKCMMSPHHTIGEKVWMFSLFGHILYLKSKGVELTKAKIAAALDCNPHTLTKHLQNLVEVGLLCPEENGDARAKLFKPCDQDTSMASLDLVRSLEEAAKAKAKAESERRVA